MVCVWCIQNLVFLGTMMIRFIPFASIWILTKLCQWGLSWAWLCIYTVRNLKNWALGKRDFSRFPNSLPMGAEFTSLATFIQFTPLFSILQHLFKENFYCQMIRLFLNPNYNGARSSLETLLWEIVTPMHTSPLSLCQNSIFYHFWDNEGSVWVLNSEWDVFSLIYLGKTLEGSRRPCFPPYTLKR